MIKSTFDFEISVVIPTLGGNILNETIKRINNGSLKPAEILICIPENYTSLLKLDYFDNIRILATKFMGQVAQRAHGFKNAKFNYVLQLDDDIILEYNSLKNLVNNLKSIGNNSAVSPVFLFKDNRNDVYKIKSNNILKLIFYFFINGNEGFVPGIITRAGTEIGVNQIYIRNKNHKVSWLPGGCILHYKNNLIDYNYFPFKGKAYCEDLFHSKLIENKGVSMFVIKNTYALIDDPNLDNISYKSSLINICNDFKCRLVFIKKYKLSKFRFLLFYVFIFINNFLKKIFK